VEGENIFTCKANHPSEEVVENLGDGLPWSWNFRVVSILALWVEVSQIFEIVSSIKEVEAGLIRARAVLKTASRSCNPSLRQVHALVGRRMDLTDRRREAFFIA
jgi:hypothetical protein